jgi:glycine cleavage system H lipoate-binding protein
MTKVAGFEIPTGYSFHPGHTWVCDEGRQNARVGMDAFAAQLFGKIDRIETVELNRWVRQGQKLWTVTREGKSVDMLSPIEGVLVSLNHQVIKNPEMLNADPYKEGWVCVVKSPDMVTNLKNLIQGPLVAPWMQNTLSRIGALTQQFAPSRAQDGGVPVNGLLMQMDPATQERIVKEFFLT